MYRRAIDFIGLLVGVCFGLIAVLIPLDMALRALSVGNLPWLSEAVEYAIFAGVFLAVPWAMADNAHVKVDLASELLPPAWSRRLAMVVCVAGLAICIALVFIAVSGALDAHEFGAMVRRHLVVPEWWLFSVFGLAMTLTAVEFVIRLRGLLRLPPDSRPEHV